MEGQPITTYEALCCALMNTRTERDGQTLKPDLTGFENLLGMYTRQ